MKVFDKETGEYLYDLNGFMVDTETDKSTDINDLPISKEVYFKVFEGEVITPLINKKKEKKC